MTESWLIVDLVPEFKRDFEFINNEYKKVLDIYRRVYVKSPGFEEAIERVNEQALDLEEEFDEFVEECVSSDLSHKIQIRKFKWFVSRIELIKKGFAELNEQHLQTLHKFVE